MEDSYQKVASFMFDEYNELSAKYDLPYFDSIDELEVILRDNIDAEMISDLEEDAMARMALAGFLTSLMTQIETHISMGALDDDTTH